MDELSKLRQKITDYSLKAIKLDYDRQMVHSDFYTQTEETESREDLIKEYQRLYKERVELDMEIIAVQNCLDNMKYEIELKKLDPLDKLGYRFKLKQMRNQIKRDKKLSLNFHSNNANASQTDDEESVSVVTVNDEEIEVVKPDPKFFTKKGKVDKKDE